MATVGRVVVEVDADTAKFVRKLDRSSKRTQQWGAKLQRFGIAATRKLAAGAGVAAAAIGALTQRGIVLGDEVSKAAQKLGLGTTELLGLQFAASQSGVAINQLTLGVQRMTRRISEAARDTGEAKAAIKELGLDARQLNRLSIDQQFGIIADAMADVERASDRVRLGFKLFDSEGVALINVLEGGSAGLEEFFGRARELGLFLTDTQQRVIEDTSSAQDELAASFKGLSLQLGATFGPALQTAAESVTEFLVKITNGLPHLAAWASEMFGIQRAVEDMSMAGVEAELDALHEALREVQVRRREAEAGLEKSAARGTQRLGLQNALNDMLEREAELAARITELWGRQQALNVAEEEAKKIEALNSQLEEIAVTATRLGNLPTIKLLDPEETTDNLDRISKTFRSFGQGMRRGLEDSMADAFLGVEQSFGDMLRRMAAQAAASVVFNALFSKLSGGEGAFGSFVQGLQNEHPPFASGGHFKVGGSGIQDQTLVQFRATRGEEVSVAPRGMSSGGGGVSIQNNITIQTTGDPSDVEFRMARALQISEERTIAKIRQMRHRGKM